MKMNPNMANREVADLVLLDYKTKKVFMPIDFANVTTTDFTANRVFAKGGQGAPNRVGFDGERAGTLKISTQIMPVKLFSLFSGADIAKTCKSLKKEAITADGEGNIELSETPKAGTVQLFAAGDEGGVDLMAGGRSLSLSDKKISGGEANANYVAYYFIDKASGVEVVKFNAKTFPKAFEVRGYMPFKTEDDEIVKCELVYYKAQPQATFSLAFQNTGDPTSIDITLDCFANADGDIYDMAFETGEGA